MLFIGLAGILGALARFGLSTLWNPTTATLFPWGTFICNLVGCLLLGFITFTDRLPIPAKLQMPITTGFIGSFTTFSTFSYETVHMFHDRHPFFALIYVLGSLWGGLAFTWIGVRAALLSHRGGATFMSTWLWPIGLVSIGGFVGAISRYGLGMYMSRRFPSSIPYGTLTINLLGCFLIGILMRYHAFDDWKLLIGTGFMGAFTTFSTLNLESIKQLRAGLWKAWMIYTMLSYTGGILLTFIGYYI